MILFFNLPDFTYFPWFLPIFLDFLAFFSKFYRSNPNAMKTKTLLLGLALGISFLSVQADPVKPVPVSLHQTAFSFLHFQAHRQQNGVALQWMVTDPSSVVAFVISRSYDGVTFYDIDNIPPDAAKLNKYLDNSAFPGYIWYQIDAVLSDGTVVSSAVEQVRIVSKK